MRKEGKIFISTATFPWYNQAYEEHLLQNGGDRMILYLWQNQQTVVLGRHQNAWREVQLDKLSQDGGFLARRISGGGAVYHDLGNLNFTFLMPRQDYDLPRQLGLILTAVRSLGVDANFSGRNDLEIAGRKFSGNAFCLKKERAMHHGTILFASDFGRLGQYLSPSVEKMRAKGVSSVHARVVNLNEYAPGLNREQLIDALCAAFRAVYDAPPPQYVDTQQAAPAALYQKYSAWEWRLGASPAFETELSHRFAWGEFQLCLNSEQGRIANATVYSDAMDAELIERIRLALPGLPWRGSSLQAVLLSLAQNNAEAETLQALTAWLAEEVAY